MGSGASDRTEMTATPSAPASITSAALAALIPAMAQPLLQPSDGSQFVAPTFTPVDALKTIVITATPQQMAVLETLAASLDSPELAAPSQPARLNLARAYRSTRPARQP